METRDPDGEDWWPGVTVDLERRLINETKEIRAALGSIMDLVGQSMVGFGGPDSFGPGIVLKRGSEQVWPTKTSEDQEEHDG